MEKWTDNINGEPYTSRGVRTVRRRVLGNTTIVIWKGAGYLAYIVSVKVRPDGSRIETNNIGRNESEKARKQIEMDFGLVKAEAHKRQIFELKPVNVSKVQYGKAQTKQAVSNVLSTVLNTYKYTSVAELNAALKQYNVMADGGGKDSRIYKNSGLVYRILNEKSVPVGVPVKASDFHFNPGLKYLQKQFLLNEPARLPHKSKVKNAIDLALLRPVKPDLQGLISALEKDSIRVVVRQSDAGTVYGITYVDHRTKCVFNGSTLGKQYSANAIQQRCRQAPVNQMGTNPNTRFQGQAAGRDRGQPEKNRPQIPTFDNIPAQATERNEIIDSLFEPIKDDISMPLALRRKKKKKQKNISNHL